MASIRLEKINKRFGTAVALHETSLEIADGEFFILVGPSGCGKSTLLNIVVGLEPPSGGDVFVDGRRVTEIDPKDRNMAMVFQSYAIYPHMSVRENLAFPLKLAKLSQQEIHQRVEKAAELLELSDLLERRPAQLSGGQRQRVAMGRAIVREPAAFLMDEPLSNLDTKLRLQMRTQISQLQQRLGTTTVYVTHDQTEAMTLGDRIAVMRNGSVEQIGTPRELYAEPATLFVADFIGAPSMNFVTARVEEGRLCLPMATLPLPERFQGRELPASLVAGVRPEHLVEVSPEHAQRSAAQFEVQVELREWLGTESIVYFEVRDAGAAALTHLLDASTAGTAARQWAARLEASSETVEGGKLTLGLDPEYIQLFDAASGARIQG